MKYCEKLICQRESRAIGDKILGSGGGFSLLIVKNKIRIRFGKHYQTLEKCLSILNLRGVK
jgi:hypothetical protein